MNVFRHGVCVTNIEGWEWGKGKGKGKGKVHPRTGHEGLGGGVDV